MNTVQEGTIFVVDDDPLVRKALQRLLKSAGYFTETFPSAKEVLESGYHSEGTA